MPYKTMVNINSTANNTPFIFTNKESTTSIKIDNIADTVSFILLNDFGNKKPKINDDTIIVIAYRKGSIPLLQIIPISKSGIFNIEPYNKSLINSK